MQSERPSLSSSSLSLATVSGSFGAQRSSSSSLTESGLGSLEERPLSLSLSLLEVLQTAGGSGVGVGGYARLVRELVALEKKYVERLQLLCKVFREPLARLAPKVRIASHRITAFSSFTSLEHSFASARRALAPLVFTAHIVRIALSYFPRTEIAHSHFICLC